jgi:hypothetical protein
LLLPGDYIQIGAHYANVTEQLDSGGGGQATVNFEPPFHVAPAHAAAVVFNDPKGIFRLDTNKQEWDSDQFGKHVFAFPIVEAL